MLLLWAQQSKKEDWGFLLIDVWNAFNEENRTAMFWDVCHEWPSGTQFILNCYHHWATLVVRNTEDGSGHFLHSKESVTQGNPLATIKYGIGVLPIIIDFRNVHSHVTQPWYADDAGAWGKSRHILEHFKYLQARGTPRGYFLEPNKSILVVSLRNVARADELLRVMGMKIITGSRYLGDFVRDRAGRLRTAGWRRSSRGGKSR